jgi:2-oxoglutarate/2-oxoacid ferredoxin oxidoreductase subunit alpha
MRFNIIIGGKAGQGINKFSEIISNTLIDYGYFVFNYRDYPSIIRGGHNFNVLSVSDKIIESHESKGDFLISLDENTKKIHKDELKKEGIILDYKDYNKYGRNLNVALSAVLVKILGIPKEVFLKEIESQFKGKTNYKTAVEVALECYESQESKMNLKKLDNKITLTTGSKAVALGAVNSKLDLYIAYPMTPATNALHELAGMQEKYGHMVFQGENEISVANMAIGASFAGARTMVGTSGGGFDLMSETLSLQGISEIPMTVYLASRVGPGTGVPTYTSQCDLDIALRAGHGEFPRIVIAPGNPKESIEKTNEILYLSNKYNMLGVLLGDKHLAESEFCHVGKPNPPLKVKINNPLPGQKGVVAKGSSYEQNKYGLTTESAELTLKNNDLRTKKYEEMKKEVKEKFEMYKIHGKRNSKNLVIGWGSTRGAIVDAIKEEDFKFLQVLYFKTNVTKNFGRN